MAADRRRRVHRRGRRGRCVVVERTGLRSPHGVVRPPAARRRTAGRLAPTARCAGAMQRVARRPRRASHRFRSSPLPCGAGRRGRCNPRVGAVDNARRSGAIPRRRSVPRSGGVPLRARRHMVAPLRHGPRLTPRSRSEQTALSPGETGCRMFTECSPDACAATSGTVRRVQSRGVPHVPKLRVLATVVCVTAAGTLAPVALSNQTVSAAGTIALTAIGSPYIQEFDTLSNTAASTTNALAINGWELTETGGGTRDNEQYGVDTGGSGTGDTYSYGSADATDRALGGLQSGTLVPIIGASFSNNTGGVITSLDVAYTGEQWRIGNTAAARDDRIDFQYSLDATSLTTGTWVDVNPLDFTNVVKTAVAVGALDGNNAAKRASVAGAISGPTISKGAGFL